MQFFRFALVGLVATATTYAVLVGLVELMHADPVAASVAGYLVGMVVNYLLNYHYTFRSGQRHHVAAPKFVVVLLIGLAINTALMHLGVNRLGLNYMLVQLGAIAVVMTWNYLANRYWSFAD